MDIQDNGGELSGKRDISDFNSGEPLMVKLQSADKLKGTANRDSRTCNHPCERGRMA